MTHSFWQISLWCYCRFILRAHWSTNQSQCSPSHEIMVINKSLWFSHFVLTGSRFAICPFRVNGCTWAQKEGTFTLSMWSPSPSQATWSCGTKPSNCECLSLSRHSNNYLSSRFCPPLSLSHLLLMCCVTWLIISQVIYDLLRHETDVMSFHIDI